MDLTIMLLACLACWLLTIPLVAVGMSQNILFSIAMLAMFVLRNFYFVLFELHWGGTTPGKRRMGLRVISRDGGPLTVEAIFIRNLLRELETFMPLIALFSPTALVPNSPGLGMIGGTVWLFVFMLMPLLGKDRLRCGDLVAGTLVIQVPQLELLEDLAGTRRIKRRGQYQPAPTEAEYHFTPEQLDLYGIRELQVLEDMLRRWQDGTLERATLKLVCGKILNKTGWQGEGKLQTIPFLQAFYKAQRARLEHKMLFGKRQERKKR